MLLCFRRADGKLLWESKVTYKDKESTHPTNPFCSASPATDGERVYVSHGSAGLYCYDCHGKQVWHRDTGKQEHIWGNASSPILYGDLCILWVGPGENQVLLAVNKKTGQEVWRHVELGGKSGSGSAREWRGSWSTPIVARVNGRDELILSVPEKVLAFDPQTGKELWSCAGLGPLVYSSPVVSHDGIVVAMSGFHNAALAVRAGGEGDVTQKRLWLHKPQNPQRIGSGVVVGEHLYLLNEPGTASCLDLKTGEDRWNRERVSSSSWSSMVAAGDRLYITNQSGETIVLKTGAKPVVLARNKLGEPVRASIAVSDGDVFVRTHKALWCISEKK
jgi:outer membrane protein assembly factor BamB